MDIPQGDSDKEILERARARFRIAEEAETLIRKEGIEDLKFVHGDQWEDDVKTARQLEKRPCLTINRLPSFIRQVTNEQRQNRPGIKVNPVDDEATVETADVIQGLVRHIEYASNAEIAYDRASDGQVRNGFGYFRIGTKYVDPMSFEQEICVMSIPDPFSVYLDPGFKEPDGSDLCYGFIIDEILKEHYRKEYPDSQAANMFDWTTIGASSSGWMTKEMVRLAEYYEKTFKKAKLHRLSDGQIILSKNLDRYRQFNQANGRPDVEIKESRETEIPKITWYKINGLEILDRTDVPGSFIPIIPVLGDEIIVNGKKSYESLIRHAKDPQRMLNYWETAKTEMIALAPRAPFVGVEKQFEGFEDSWRSANVKSHAFLQYKDITLASGQAAPPPQRMTFEPPVQAINAALSMSIEHIKATTGIFDDSLGIRRPNEVSGVAIQRRVNQSAVANFHFSDNIKRSIKHGGRIIVEWIPEVYSGPQAVRVLAEDDQQKIVKINQMFTDEADGKQKAFHLDKGKYDVTVDTGPSHQTKRQEAVESMLDMMKAAPDTMKVALDLMVRNMDWEGADKIADRLKKTLPPGIAEPDPKDKQPNPQQAQLVIAKQNQMLQQQAQLIGVLDDKIRTKQLDIESKERIESQKQRHDLIMEMMKHDMAGAKMAFEAEINRIDRRLELLDVNQPVDKDENDLQQPAGQSQPPPGGPPA